jgi:CRP/FNR family transcriptional regulator, cyclic AMP receptor protein
MRRALHLLGILDDVDIEWMATNGNIEHVRAGEVLIRENTAVSALFILLDGQLSVYLERPGNIQIARLLPGEIVGEISFVSSRAPTATVAAVQDSEVLMLSRDALLVKLKKDPAFGARFYRAIASFLADRLHVTTSRFGYGSAAQDADPDQIDDSQMEDISLAMIRFDKLLRNLRKNHKAKDAKPLAS